MKNENYTFNEQSDNSSFGVKRQFFILHLSAALILHLLSQPVFAQQKIYPDPVMTPAVERMLRSRSVWQRESKHRAGELGNNAEDDELPLSVDNSRSIFFPPIISQQGGSCAQASGIGYMFTYEMNRLLQRNASDSKAYRYSYLFSWNLLNGGKDEGGFVIEGLNVARRFGMMTEEDFGFAATYAFQWPSGYEKYLRAMHNRVSKIYRIDNTTLEAIQNIKHYLFNKGSRGSAGGIISFSAYSSNWTISSNYDGPSATGYHSILTELATSGAHAMTIVGYDDLVESIDSEGNTHLGAFIVVNSWGDYWQDNGHFYLPYHFFTNRGPGISDTHLSTSMTGIDVYEHQPKIVYKIRMNYSSRDDLAFSLGASDSYFATSPSTLHTAPIFEHQGGDGPMPGAYANKDANVEFALDYTDYLPSDHSSYPKYFLQILCAPYGKSMGTGSIEHLSVIDYTDATHPKEYICRNLNPRELKRGGNLYAVPARYWGNYSCSTVTWQKDASTASSSTFIVRTANGKYAKLRFRNYNPDTHSLTLDYTLQKDGSRKFR